MRFPAPENGFSVMLVVGTTILLLPYFLTLYWLACILLSALPAATLVLTRRWPDRAFWLACAGQPAAIACGSSGIWTGLFAEVMLGGIVAGSLGLLASREDSWYLALYTGLALALALLVHFSNHVLFLMLAFCAALALFAVVMAICGYRFRKGYSGERA